MKSHGDKLKFRPLARTNLSCWVCEISSGMITTSLAQGLRTYVCVTFAAVFVGSKEVSFKVINVRNELVNDCTNLMVIFVIASL